MTRLFVEGWAPGYGSPLETDERMVPPEGSVDTAVEPGEWLPRRGTDDGTGTIVFVDGVRRVDARLTLDEPEGPVPGICGSFGVGSVVWDRLARSSSFESVLIERWAIFSKGKQETFPPLELQPAVASTTTASAEPDAPVKELQAKMRRAEARCAAGSSDGGRLVFSDGPLEHGIAGRVVGVIKSHVITYLPPDLNVLVGSIPVGHRTPLFTIWDHRKYSWYVRLADLAGGHPWSGVVRCETPGQLPLEEVLAIADRSAAILPLVSSEPHLDPRAPQNLVPIAALETHLRHLMGDPGLVYRAMREAVMREAS
jgi:hypothetical protein